MNIKIKDVNKAIKVIKNLRPVTAMDKQVLMAELMMLACFKDAIRRKNVR